ncbi:MAG: ATP-binding cassette domain-containing protein [Acidobacteriota bacterium]|jgi:lipopolysaccharide transport system ATP-binding protein|nr:ATP-binding cassette domain-containing protein [Acidobacteriota bacterium]
MSAIITFDNVWKKFKKGERHDSLRDLIPATAKALFRKNSSSELEEKEFWAVEDVSFEVKHGEALGIIGPNGAGKSTILKLLTKILRPNRGTCSIVGRTGALIEISAGFHPDLTGRENIYLQGAIMGMRRKEITSRFDEIVDFAGLSSFIDTPVKRYSSGMNARLGFSIAAHLNPEALVIDEVLSVGDVAFQQKCINRMKEFKHNGVAIVFVSHNLQAVSMLCDNALYLKNKTMAMGKVTQVLEEYLKDTIPNTDFSERYLKVNDFNLSSSSKSLTDIAPRTSLNFTVNAIPKIKLKDYHIGFKVVRSTDLLVVYDGNWTGDELGCPELSPNQPVKFSFEFTSHLTKGQYYISWHIFYGETQSFLVEIVPAGHFSVDEGRTWAGVADLDVKAKVS